MRNNDFPYPVGTEVYGVRGIETKEIDSYIYIIEKIGKLWIYLKCKIQKRYKGRMKFTRDYFLNKIDTKVWKVDKKSSQWAKHKKRMMKYA
jgi:hypothetical protein